MELTVVAIKREDGLYHFDHPHNDTVEELLMNGTEEAIDEHCYFKTGKYPIEDDGVESGSSQFLKVEPLNKLS